jgi:tetratricopeptide (TPR) repeat protein
VFDYLELGEIHKSQTAIDAYEAIAREFRQSRHLWPVPLMRAMFAIAEGRAADAITLLAEARTIVGADPEPIAQAVVAWHEVGQVVLLERVDEVDRVFAEMERRFQLPTHAAVAPAMIRSARVKLLARFGGDPAEINGLLESLPWDVAFFNSEPGPLISVAEGIAIAGNVKLAARVYDAMAAVAHRLGTAGRSGFFCVGPGSKALALFAGTLGRFDEAIDLLERTVARNEQLGFRVLIGDARCWQAHYLALRRQAGDAERARTCLDEADRYARQLNLPRLALRVAHTRTALDATPAAQSASAPAAARERTRSAPSFSLAREGDYWAVTAGTVTARIKDARGMQMLAELVAAPGRDVHALALMGSDGEAADGGDAGELLDKEAIAEYRERLQALEAELAEAESWSDTGRMARARAERDAIASELSRGVGLGGRARRASAAAERARVNVQRRVRGAIKMIGHSLPELGAYLERTVRTGTFCSYEPF